MNEDNRTAGNIYDADIISLFQEIGDTFFK